MASPSGRIVVGEAPAPAKDTFLAEGTRGAWHAYVKDASDDDEGGLVLIHADALGAHAALFEARVPLANLNVEGGMMAMISAEVRDDETFQEATMFPVSPIVQGRGCVVRTGGDGAHRVSGTRSADRYVLPVVDFQAPRARCGRPRAEVTTPHHCGRYARDYDRNSRGRVHPEAREQE